MTPDLFSFFGSVPPIKRARSTDPDTSHEAAERVDFDSEHYRKILDALSIRPMIYTEISAATGLDRHAVGRRLGELENAGAIEPTGEKRATPSGRKAREWRRK